jgi:2OG-Fe(II) oxygenase superfamily
MCPQPTLFGAEPAPLAGSVRYIPDFIGHAEADRLFAAFQKLQWRPNDLFTLRAPRDYAWMGVPFNTPLYRKIAVTEWTPDALSVKALVEERTQRSFDSLNFDLYRDNEDSLSSHFDGDGRSQATFPVAIVSLGEVRKFNWRGSDGGNNILPLEHGSLLIMPPGFQQTHRHAFPKQMKKCGPRIALTFRRIVGP